MNDLIYRLLLFLNSSKEKNINYIIATTILHNIRKIPDMTINQIAELCYTSPAAISRFCRKLGYPNLAEFKRKSASEVLLFEMRDLIPKGLNELHTREMIINEMRNEINNELDRAVESIDLKLIDRVLELIFSHEKIYLFGTRYSQLMIQDLQFKFASLGKLINVAIDVQEQEKMSEEIDEKSLVILISPTGRFMNYHKDIWNNIEKSNSSLVVLTQEKNNLYKDRAEYIIYFSNNITGYSFIEAQRYSLTFVIEYMYIRYYSLYYSHLDNK